MRSSRTGLLPRPRFPIGPLATLTLVLACSILGQSAQADFTLRPVKPAAGTDGFLVHLANNTAVFVSVTFVGTEEVGDKAVKIAHAMDLAGLATTTTPDNRVIVRGNKSNVDAQDITWQSGSGENPNGMAANSEGGGAAYVQFAGNLNGQDAQGGDALYSAGFAFDGISVQQTVNYSSLGFGTLNSLTQTLYNGLLGSLPVLLQPNLHLDLGQNRISFDFPTNALDPQVLGGANDTGTQGTTFLATTVPEPSSCVMALTAALGVSLEVTRRRRKNHPRSGPVASL